jgi:hypothetical protein
LICNPYKIKVRWLSSTPSAPNSRLATAAIAGHPGKLARPFDSLRTSTLSSIGRCFQLARVIAHLPQEPFNARYGWSAPRPALVTFVVEIHLFSQMCGRTREPFQPKGLAVWHFGPNLASILTGFNYVQHVDTLVGDLGHPKSLNGELARVVNLEPVQISNIVIRFGVDNLHAVVEIW